MHYAGGHLDGQARLKLARKSLHNMGLSKHAVGQHRPTSTMPNATGLHQDLLVLNEDDSATEFMEAEEYHD